MHQMSQIMVVSSKGYFHSYNIDLENGGECSLMRTFGISLCSDVVLRLLDSALADETSND